MNGRTDEQIGYLVFKRSDQKIMKAHNTNTDFNPSCHPFLIYASVTLYDSEKYKV